MDCAALSDLERDIEVIKGCSMNAEPALLKTKTINPHVDDPRERWKQRKKDWWQEYPHQG